MLPELAPEGKVTRSEVSREAAATDRMKAADYTPGRVMSGNMPPEGESCSYALGLLGALTRFGRRRPRRTRQTQMMAIMTKYVYIEGCLQYELSERSPETSQRECKRPEKVGRDMEKRTSSMEHPAGVT